MSSRVVVNADDLGVSRGATLGILEAHRNGIVTSASLAATTPFYQHAVDSCVRTCPGLGIGLHFTLTSGKPVSAPERVPLLIDEKGFFRWRFVALFRAVASRSGAKLLDQVALELEAQLDRLLADGIRPDHLDGERHVHLIPGIFELVVAAAERHRVPFVRAGRDIGTRFLRLAHLPRLALQGGFLKAWLLAILSRKNRRHLGQTVRTADHVASYLYTGRIDLLAPGLLSGPSEGGVIEIMVHPGIPEESRGINLGNRELERYLASKGRQRELDACLDARNRLGGLRLTNFTQLAAETGTTS